MLCVHGEEKRMPGSTGLFFICNYGRHAGNQCRFSKICSQTGKYVMATDRHGNTCSDYCASMNAQDWKL